MIFCTALRSMALIMASRTNGLCIADESVLKASRISLRNSLRYTLVFLFLPRNSRSDTAGEFMTWHSLVMSLIILRHCMSVKSNTRVLTFPRPPPFQ